MNEFRIKKSWVMVTSYELILDVIDEYGNIVSSPNINFTTSADEVAPEILQVNTDSTLYPGKTTKIQTIIHGNLMSLLRDKCSGKKELLIADQFKQNYKKKYMV